MWLSSRAQSPFSGLLILSISGLSRILDRSALRPTTPSWAKSLAGSSAFFCHGGGDSAHRIAALAGHSAGGCPGGNAHGGSAGTQAWSVSSSTDKRPRSRWRPAWPSCCCRVPLHPFSDGQSTHLTTPRGYCLRKTRKATLAANTWPIATTVPSGASASHAQCAGTARGESRCLQRAMS